MHTESFARQQERTLPNVGITLLHFSQPGCIQAAVVAETLMTADTVLHAFALPAHLILKLFAHASEVCGLWHCCLIPPPRVFNPEDQVLCCTELHRGMENLSPAGATAGSLHVLTTDLSMQQGIRMHSSEADMVPRCHGQDHKISI